MVGYSFCNTNNHISNEIQLQRFAHTYILQLLRGQLFPDHFGNLVPIKFLSLLENFVEAREYNWGLVVLSYLYHELCKATDDQHEIRGMVNLVQLWAWDRFPLIAPNAPLQLMVGAPHRTKYDLYYFLFFSFT